MLDSLDGAAVRRWCALGLESLRRHQHEIDLLNVYPVPDGDTGTNLVLTVGSAHRALLSGTEGDRLADAAVPGVNGAASSDDGVDGAAASDDGVNGAASSEDATGRTGAAPPHPDRRPVGDPGSADGPVAHASGADTGGNAQARLGPTLRRMARGALLGARGNSGVIVSQLLKGMADALAPARVVRGRELAAALRQAATAAYAAVATPVEGTVLTVARAAADGATRADSDDLLTVSRAAAAASVTALSRTPEQLPVLARAGVVDAGGRGLVLLLEALVEAVHGRGGAHAVGGREYTPQPKDGGVGREHTTPPKDGGVGREHSPQPMDGGGPPDAGPGVPVGAGAAAPGQARSRSYGYEVQYLLDASGDAIPDLRDRLAALGDSLVIVDTGPPHQDGHPGEAPVPTPPSGAAGASTPPSGAAGAASPPSGAAALSMWNVHVHVDDVGAAIEAGVRVGRPHRIQVTRFADQIDPDTVDQPSDAVSRAVVAVVPGGGLADVFRAEGAIVVPGPRPSTADLLQAIRSAEASQVVLLPNDPDTHAVAAAAATEARAAGIRVGVVPTRSPVQAVAVLAVRDPRRRFEDEMVAMAEASGACRYAEVTWAARDALTVAGPCRRGDVLALVNGEVNAIGTDLTGTCRALLDHLLGSGGELVTLVLGADATPDLAAELTAHCAGAWPLIEVRSYVGGQPHYPLLVGVE